MLAHVELAKGSLRTFTRAISVAMAFRHARMQLMSLKFACEASHKPIALME